MADQQNSAGESIKSKARFHPKPSTRIEKTYTNRKPARGPNSGYTKDPFQRPSTSLDRDYTKFIEWTPRSIAIAVLLLAVPYGGVVAVIAISLSWIAALPFLILPIVLAAFMAALYGLSKMSL